MLAILPSAAPTPDAAPETTVIAEETSQHLSFNVMPDKSVTETLRFKEYRVSDDGAEATFDREYHSSMEKSPDHLIFLSALVHAQKLLYLFLCHRYGVEYGPHGTERFKMWPTKVEVKIPELIDRTEDLVQSLRVLRIKHHRGNAYKAWIESRVGSLRIAAEVPFYRF